MHSVHQLSHNRLYQLLGKLTPCILLVPTPRKHPSEASFFERTSRKKLVGQLDLFLSSLSDRMSQTARASLFLVVFWRASRPLPHGCFGRGIVGTHSFVCELYIFIKKHMFYVFYIPTAVAYTATSTYRATQHLSEAQETVYVCKHIGTGCASLLKDAEVALALAQQWKMKANAADWWSAWDVFLAHFLTQTMTHEPLHVRGEVA